MDEAHIVSTRRDRHCAPPGIPWHGPSPRYSSSNSSRVGLRMMGATRQRLPAFGRRLKTALDAGMRPAKGGGSIIVTSDWDYARAFDPGRVVCPPEDGADEYDFAFLNGCEVVVLVPERDEPHGRRLLARIRDAGAKLAVLSVNRSMEPC